jgi:hypothetical protein
MPAAPGRPGAPDKGVRNPPAAVQRPLHRGKGTPAALTGLWLRCQCPAHAEHRGGRMPRPQAPAAALRAAWKGNRLSAGENAGEESEAAGPGPAAPKETSSETWPPVRYTRAARHAGKMPIDPSVTGDCVTVETPGEDSAKSLVARKNGPSTAPQ